MAETNMPSTPADRGDVYKNAKCVRQLTAMYQTEQISRVTVVEPKPVALRPGKNSGKPGPPVLPKPVTNKAKDTGSSADTKHISAKYLDDGSTTKTPKKALMPPNANVSNKHSKTKKGYVKQQTDCVEGKLKLQLPSPSSSTTSTSVSKQGDCQVKSLLSGPRIPDEALKAEHEQGQKGEPTEKPETPFKPIPLPRSVKPNKTAAAPGAQEPTAGVHLTLTLAHELSGRKMADLKPTSGQDDHVAPAIPIRMPIGKQMVHPHPTPTPVPTDAPSGAQESTADVPLKLAQLELKEHKTADVIPTSGQENPDRGNDVAPPIPVRKQSKMGKQVDDANPTNDAQTPVPTDTPSDGGEEPGKEVEGIALGLELHAKPPDPMRALKPGQSRQKKAPLPKRPSTERPPPPPLPPPRHLQPIYANSEPLYHVYQEISHMRALNRLRHASDSSESAFSPDDYDSLYGVAPAQELVRVKQLVSLWSQQYKVIESGLMSSLTKRQIQHQEAMFEIVTSEASYLKSLNVFINHFMESDSLNRILSPRDKNDLFSNIVQVKNISESLLSRLMERVEMSPLISDVCDILYEYSLNHFKPLVSYVINIPCQITTFKKFSEAKDKGLFSSKIKLLEDAPVCEKLPFLSFLSVPYQRMTRYQLLVKNVISKAGDSVESGNVVNLALYKLEELVQQCDKGVGERTQAEQVINIANNIYFEKGMKSLAIVSQTRSLLKSGKLLVQDKAKTIIPKSVARFTQGKTYVMLLLFNDFLIIATKQKDGHLLVLDYGDRAFVMAAEVEGNDNAFLLTLMENHQGKQAEWLLSTSNTTEKLRWVEAISSNGANENEKIYQPWNCPKVQCVRDYVAAEMDELNLREEDVLCVIRKTPDGWMEGGCLRSGDCGWFPASHVEEIASDHVDARNQRERKLSLMKSKMQGSMTQSS